MRSGRQRSRAPRVKSSRNQKPYRRVLSRSRANPIVLSEQVTRIVPHSIAKGVDICGDDNNYLYIVRSDAGVYMQSDNLNKGGNIEVFDLHYACQWGDHYLANDGYFYIVQKDSYRRVTNMNTDADAVVYSLHPHCQGGDHYFSMSGSFYIVYKDRDIYRRTSNMNNDQDAVEYSLNHDCGDGLYYWGYGDYVYFVKPVGEWGPLYHKTSNLNRDSDSNDYSFATDVVNFLPGGIAITKGPAFGEWKLLKSFENESKTPVEWTKEISHQKGAERSKLSSIEHNWNIKVSASYKSGDIAAAFAKYQFSLSASYGGKSVDTTTESWKEVTTVTEKVSLSVAPGQQVYFWQYQLGFGEEDILFCRKMKLTHNHDPPEETPLTIV
ncbi:uncharacterized protein LOC114530657 [Dendronephthya gigantea]|uniref:uncharacterized protein LOC114530657 n=1 Tax=Dendronephthya gigantea TaxID=151771 RepID=UPI00106D07C5|nr:uncharacterized protein LOC114530657 [Dendronephthya gigantea]